MEQPATQRMSRARRILAVMFVASLALDFKGTVGGSSIQFLMAGINGVTFLLLAVSYRMALPRRGLGAFVFWGWGIFLVIGTLGAMLMLRLSVITFALLTASRCSLRVFWSSGGRLGIHVMLR